MFMNFVYLKFSGFFFLFIYVHSRNGILLLEEILACLGTFLHLNFLVYVYVYLCI